MNRNLHGQETDDCVISKSHTHSTANSSATLNGDIMDPQIAVKFEIRDALQVHSAQT